MEEKRAHVLGISFLIGVVNLRQLRSVIAAERSERKKYTSAIEATKASSAVMKTSVSFRTVIRYAYDLVRQVIESKLEELETD